MRIAKDIIPLLAKLVQAAISDPHVLQTHQLFMQLEDVLYSVDIVIANTTTFNPMCIDGNHDDYVAHEIQVFIDTCVYNGMDSNRFEIHYNFNETMTKNIHIYCNKVSSNLFIELDDNVITNSKEAQDQKIKDRILNILSDNEKGLALSEITQKTRTIRDPQKRLDILNEMVESGTITSNIESVSGKQKKTYRKA